MDQAGLEQLLAGLNLGSLRYFASVTSTNDLAARWADAGAPHRSLIAADEQTAGRGRLQRRWFTPPGSSLAFSLILKTHLPSSLMRCTALGALGVCDTLNQAFSPLAPACIKWPNDVLVQDQKLAGVLAEAHWKGSQLEAMIIGVGINVAPASVPPADSLAFPATCVESVVRRPVDRWELLRKVLKRLLYWEEQFDSPDFIAAWENRLAFRDKQVQVQRESQPPLSGWIHGLASSGALKLRTLTGELIELEAGELHLRPVDSSA